MRNQKSAPKTTPKAPVKKERGSRMPEFEGTALERMARKPKLSREEARRLIALVQEGNNAAFNKLIEHNVRLVIKVANTFRWSGVPLEDLVQEGCMGLTVAIQRFNPEFPSTLSTYATWWIRHFIQRQIENTARLVRIPTHAEKSLSGVMKAYNKLRSTDGHVPTESEIAEEIGVEPTEKNLRRIAHLMSNFASRVNWSLDEPAYNHDGGVFSRHDQFPCRKESPEEEVAQAEITDALHHAITRLPTRERTIIMRRFYGEETLGEIGDGKEFRVCRERIRQLEERACNQLAEMLCEYRTA